MIIARAPIIAYSFTKASSFINIKGDHPEIFTNVIYNKIVLNKEELTDDNWLYIGDESKDLVSAQIDTMIHYKDWLPIIEE